MKRLPDDKIYAIRASLESGLSFGAIARNWKVGTDTVWAVYFRQIRPEGGGVKNEFSPGVCRKCGKPGNVNAVSICVKCVTVAST